MKRELLKDLLNSGKDQAEIIDSIMASNGEDINNAKANAPVDTSKYIELEKYNALENSNKELTASKTELENQFNSYKESTSDYEDLKGKYNSLIEERETSRRTGFLESQKCKYPDLLMKEFDWDKVDFDKNEVNQEYMESIKTKYSGLFQAEDSNYNPNTGNPGPSSSNDPNADRELTMEQLRRL